MARTEAEKAARKAEKKEKRRRDQAEEGGAEEVSKKSKKRKSTDAAVDEDGDVEIGDVSTTDMVAVKTDDGEKKEVKTVVPLAALAPFANPLADDKTQKKVLKGVKKAAKNKALKRGVKECVKSIRKSPLATPSTSNPSVVPNGIVVLAADISPIDVISHIPVLCEDHSIPYIFVPSRAELGAAGATKRPTSVVMVAPKVGKKAEEGDQKEWDENYRELHKVAMKLGQLVKV